jgi:hypothetical protein
VQDYHETDAAYKNGFNPADFGKCLHTLSIPGHPEAYEVGIVARPDGQPGFQPIFDFYGGGNGLMALIGTQETDKNGRKLPIKNCNKLAQAYGEQVAQDKVRAKGFRVLRSTSPEGKVLMRCVRN